jgi:hypothetical protein
MVVGKPGRHWHQIPVGHRQSVQQDQPTSAVRALDREAVVGGDSLDCQPAALEPQAACGALVASRYRPKAARRAPRGPLLVGTGSSANLVLFLCVALSFPLPTAGGRPGDATRAALSSCPGAGTHPKSSARKASLRRSAGSFGRKATQRNFSYGAPRSRLPRSVTVARKVSSTPSAMGRQQP